MINIVPLKIPFSGWLDTDARINVEVKSEQIMLLEFKTVVPPWSQETLEYFLDKFPGFKFKFWTTEGTVYLGFGSEYYQYEIAKIPYPIDCLFKTRENWSSFLQYIMGMEYAYGVSFVCNEVDRNLIMGMADFVELDEISDKEFNRLINILKETMDKKTTILKIRFFLSPMKMTEMVFDDCGKGERYKCLIQKQEMMR